MGTALGELRHKDRELWMHRPSEPGQRVSIKDNLRAVAWLTRARNGGAGVVAAGSGPDGAEAVRASARSCQDPPPMAEASSGINAYAAADIERRTRELLGRWGLLTAYDRRMRSESAGRGRRER